MEHFCTYFDANYLPRAVALLHSLRRHANRFHLWALCFDDEAYEGIMSFGAPDVTPVRLAALEAFEPRLQEVAGSRSRVEYFFTCTPTWIRYVFDTCADADRVTYLDADLLFFADPAIAFEEMGGNDILIVPHRFPEPNRHQEQYGRFNVSLVAFRRSAGAAACLDRWSAQCLEWCSDQPDGTRFADQKYLDAWPSWYAVCEASHPGVGLAPWNWSVAPLALRGDRLLVGGRPLVFFHYHGFRPLNRWLFDVGDPSCGPLPSWLRRWLYGTYIRELRAAERLLNRGGHVRRFQDIRWPQSTARHLARALIRRQLVAAAGESFFAV